MTAAISSHPEAFFSSGFSFRSVRTVSALATDTPAPFTETAKIVRHPRIDLAKAREAYRLACVAAIRGAFPAPSQHACCKDAARQFGEHWSKFNRILDGDTAQPEATLMLAVGAIYTRKTGKISPIAALLAQLEALV